MSISFRILKILTKISKILVYEVLLKVGKSKKT